MEISESLGRNFVDAHQAEMGYKGIPNCDYEQMENIHLVNQQPRSHQEQGSRNLRVTSRKLKASVKVANINVNESS